MKAPLGLVLMPLTTVLCAFVLPPQGNPPKESTEDDISLAETSRALKFVKDYFSSQGDSAPRVLQHVQYATSQLLNDDAGVKYTMTLLVDGAAEVPESYCYVEYIQWRNNTGEVVNGTQSTYPTQCWPKY